MQVEMKVSPRVIVVRLRNRIEVLEQDIAIYKDKLARLQDPATKQGVMDENKEDWGMLGSDSEEYVAKQFTMSINALEHRVEEDRELIDWLTEQDRVKITFGV